MESKKRHGKKIMADIRRILIDEWDPIGIRGAGPDDEYDPYIGGLYRLLIKNPVEDEIVEHLFSIEMAPTGPAEKRKEGLRAVAKSLLKVGLSLK